MQSVNHQTQFQTEKAATSPEKQSSKVISKKDYTSFK